MKFTPVAPAAQLFIRHSSIQINTNYSKEVRSIKHKVSHIHMDNRNSNRTTKPKASTWLIITHRLLVVAVEELRERGWAPASQRWSGGGGNGWRWVRRRRLAGDPATVEEYSKVVEASKGTRVTGLGKAEMRETEAEVRNRGKDRAIFNKALCFFLIIWTGYRVPVPVPGPHF